MGIFQPEIGLVRYDSPFRQYNEDCGLCLGNRIYERDEYAF